MLLAAAAIMPASEATLPLGLFGGVLLSAGVGLLLLLFRQRSRLAALREAGMKMLEADGAVGLLADGEGKILGRNRAATEKFEGGAPETIPRVLREFFANPLSVQSRIQDAAEREGSAREDVVTRKGHRLVSCAKLGDGLYAWRVTELGDQSKIRGTDGMSLPMLTATAGGTILYMNDAFRKLTGGRARSMDLVFTDLPLVSGGLHQVQTVDGPRTCLIAEMRGQGGRQEVYLLPSSAAAPDAPRPAANGASPWGAFDALAVPLLKVSPAGEVLAANAEARRLLPMPIGTGSRLSDLLEGLGRPIVDWLREVAEGRGPRGPQFLQCTGEHQDTFVQVVVNRMTEGDEVHLIVVLSDASEFKKLQEQFVQSQKMQAIGQLAGGIAHDFNNLLTAISGHCDLLLLRHDEDDPDFSDLNQISQNTNRAAGLVGQLLAFSRKQNMVAEVMDLREAMDDLTQLLSRLVGERTGLELRQESRPLLVQADKRQFEQVLMNLVVNARDAMPDGGEITIQTRLVTLDRDLVRDRATVPAGDYAQISVRDQGCGIPEDRLPKIFEPFYTSKRAGEGTGLGLSTAYGIVKQSSGFIFADSVVGEGTEFTVYLPIHRSAAVAAPVKTPTPAPREEAEIRDAVILLVEDEAPVRAFASRALRLQGFTVLEADCAEAALELLTDESVRVDVFVTDIIMPGMDGPTWVREALTSRPETRVVFVSGYAEDAFSEQKSLIPNSVFLPKPFALSELVSTVRTQLTSARKPAGEDLSPEAIERLIPPE